MSAVRLTLVGFATILLCASRPHAAPPDTLWTRTYGGVELDAGYSVQYTSDGGYIIAGYTDSFGAGDEDVYLIKTDADGDTVWTRTYGSADHDGGICVQQTSDGGYITAGYTGDWASDVDVYLIKTDADGDTLWTRTYGGVELDGGTCVQQTSDGCYIIAGQTSSGPGNSIYLIKADVDGDTLWTRMYGSSAWSEGRSVQQTSDGGYIIGGSRYNGFDYDVFLVKTDADGDTLWTRRYGVWNSSDDGYSVRQTYDGGYVIAGLKDSVGGRAEDVYLIKTDTDGDTLWTRTYGGTGDDVGVSVQEMPDGGYIIAGCTRSFGAGGYDVYLVRTGGVAGIPGAAEIPTRLTFHTCSPNPFSEDMAIWFYVPERRNMKVTIHDVQGRVVRELIDGMLGAGAHTVTWDGKDASGSEVSGGVYLVYLKTDGKTEISKVVVLR